MIGHSSKIIKPTDVIDVHVHIGGPSGENDQMYYYSKKFMKSTAYEGMKLVTKLAGSQITGPRYLSVLFSEVMQSKHIDKVVLLALDQVYSEDGKVEPDKTHLYVSNDYLNHISRIYPNLLFGCSVHPFDPAAIERLYECAANGAVLCKWLPSAQCIDTTHPLSQQFYRALAQIGLPLLLHVGPEETIPSSLNIKEILQVDAAAGKYGPDPGDGIAMALEAGATVIIAHSATPIDPLFSKNHKYWVTVFDQLIQRITSDIFKQPLYADISAFCLPGRYKYVKKVIPFAKEHPERFLYGSDYPIPIISFTKKEGLEEILDAFEWLANRVLPHNDFDKNYELLKPHFSEKTFKAAASILRNPMKSVPHKDRYLKNLGRKKKKFFFF